MKLIIHIGTTKTGSTTIQTFLHANREALARRHRHFVSALGNKNQLRVTVYATDLDETRDLHAKVNVRDEDQAAEFKRQLRQDFRSEIEGLDDVDSVIISNEHLHSRCHQPHCFERLDDLFGGLFEEIDVVCYLRPQLDHAVSLYSTLIRHGHDFTLDGYLRMRMQQPRHPYFDFERMLQGWIDFVGLEHVRVQLFDRCRSLEHGVLTDLAPLIGLDLADPDVVIPPNRNTAISPLGQHLFVLRNRTMPDASRRRRRLNRIFAAWVMEEFQGPGAVPTPDVAHEFQAMFESSNDWVRRTWFPDEERVLEPAWDKYESRSVDPIPAAFEAFPMDELFRASGAGRAARVLRDHAIAHEDTDLASSRRIMELAARLYPDGKVIRRRLTEYERALDQ